MNSMPEAVVSNIEVGSSYKSYMYTSSHAVPY